MIKEARVDIVPTWCRKIRAQRTNGKINPPSTRSSRLIPSRRR
jgi:hypothetical protein